MSYTRLLFHIVIRTKHSKPVIPHLHSDKLYRYIWGFIKNNNSVLYRINGMPEHIHLLVQLHPSIAPADFVRRMKTSTNAWLKQNKRYFPHFESWSAGYYAASCSIRDKERVINYIRDQREHHNREPFRDELARLLAEIEIQPMKDILSG